MMNRVRNFKLILWTIAGLASAVAIARFVFGLGAVTKLSDATPWGLWIGFDVVSGVALAAGGFVITATVYILKKDELHPIVRPAVLTAFLGYIAVIVGLLFDVGLPWYLWRPAVYWQHHSALFEVAMCVMFYTAVLALEFLPIPLEEASFLGKLRKLLVRFRLPLVILGIMLSTLHQSSLGSLFLLTPFKLHPLWYTPLLPILFFISAISLGLMMVTFESLLTSYLYRKETEMPLLSKLGKAASWVLGGYIIVRFADIAVQGKLGMAFEGTWESALFLAEVLLAFIIPAILLSISRIRNSMAGLWICSLMVVCGTVFNRVNVSGFAMQRTAGFYLPSWTEIIISAGVVSAAALVFFFVLEKFSIWERKPSDPEDALEVVPKFNLVNASLGEPSVGNKVKFSLTYILAAAIGFALLPGRKIQSEGIEPMPTKKARGGEVLFIDGNRDYYGVNFKHEMHLQSLKNCALCHHMNIPLDENSSCYECHREMYIPSDAFRHDWHSSVKGGNISCAQCHPLGQEKQGKSAKHCDECHQDIIPAGSSILVDSSYQAVSYIDAMHGLCITCHREKAAEMEGKENLWLCATCHTDQQIPPPGLITDINNKTPVAGKWVIIPRTKNETK